MWRTVLLSFKLEVDNEIHQNMFPLLLQLFKPFIICIE